MVAVGALMVIVVYLLHTHSLLKRSHLEAPTKALAAAATSSHQERSQEPKRPHSKTLWRPNMPHVGASIQDTARNLRSRRFSVA